MKCRGAAMIFVSQWLVATTHLADAAAAGDAAATPAPDIRARAAAVPAILFNGLLMWFLLNVLISDFSEVFRTAGLRRHGTAWIGR
ncbi:hypothetical protein Pta02_23570 [Planobispora takensis]|uniref:Uncharacterized protein n=1 Tax=Planobispora takensis TaxID=1367882 RepID=A0A8J3T3F5_9ACTN|nr:hypothetical protein Pta02_23570 [Planobispora takensis]